MIPKKIHYCWFGKNPLPKDVKDCIKSWRKYAPDYEIIEWNESNFDINCHPFVKAAYEAKAWAFVSDFARLKVVYDNGGIYFDTDVELLKNPDFLLDNNCYIGVQQVGNFCTTGLGFGAVKSSPVVRRMMEKYDNASFNIDNKAELACPFLNNAVAKDFGYKLMDEIWKSEELTVFPSRFFDPIAPGDTQNLLCSDSVSIHHYSASWMDSKSRLKRKIIRFIGQERIFRIKKMLKR